MNVQAVDPILVSTLLFRIKSASVSDSSTHSVQRTWGGPSIVPFQFDIKRSSPSESP